MESSNNNQESIMVREEHGFGRSNNENHLLNNPPNNASSSSSSSSSSVLVHNNCHPMMVKLSFQGSEVMVYSDDKPPLGLTLTETPDFLNLLGTQLSQASGQRSASASSYSSETHHNNPIILQRFQAQTTMTTPTNQFQSPHHHPTSDKLKASNFPAMFIKIGSWQRVAMNEGDLVAKIYYAKRKIVWEVLDGALMSKIEIQWSDIEGIKATIPDDDDHAEGVLEVELNEPPHFFRETNPRPRKPAHWTPSTDFTGGQAPICRRHLIKFPGGLLNKPYEKLLQCDPRLVELSRQPFPRIKSPYFHSEYDNTFNPNRAGGAHTSRLQQQQYCPLPASSPLLVSPPHPLMLQNLNPIRALWDDSNNPTSQMAAATYSNVSNHHWDQGTTNINIVEDNSFYSRDQDHIIIEGLPHFSSSAAATLLQEQAANYGAAAPNTTLLVSLQGSIERLLQGQGDSQSLSLDEGVLMEPFNAAPDNNGLNDHLQQQQRQYQPKELINGEIFIADGGLLCPQPLHGLPPQISNDENGMMPLPNDIDYHYYASSSYTDAGHGSQP